MRASGGRAASWQDHTRAARAVDLHGAWKIHSCLFVDTVDALLGLLRPGGTMTAEWLYERGVKTRCYPAVGGPLDGKIIRMPKEAVVFAMNGVLYNWSLTKRAWLYAKRMASR